MNRYILYIWTISSIIFVSCNNKSKKPDTKNSSSVNSIIIEDSILGQNLDKMNFDSIKRLTQAEYDSLHLAQIKSLSDYGPNDLTMGRFLFEGENGKLLTIKIITEGEITEYLLSYDTKGKLVDSLIVAYEDMVEYYTQVSSSIKQNEILVQTINFSYDGADGNEEEKADTSLTKYQITPELRFLTD